jgi:hypothetical protein
MDDNAQNPPVSNTTTPVSQPAAAPVSQQPSHAAQRPMEPPTAPRHPEQGPVPRVREVQTTPEEAEAATSVQASSDDSPDTPETPATSEQEVAVKESHPDVEVPNDLKEAGVSPSDAKRDQLLEERKQLELAAPQDPAQTPAATDSQTIESLSQMDLVQAQEAAKVQKKPRNAISWIIREVLRFRKQEQPTEAPAAEPQPQASAPQAPEPVVTAPTESAVQPTQAQPAQPVQPPAESKEGALTK